jgi:hypothetical protein
MMMMMTMMMMTMMTMTTMMIMVILRVAWVMLYKTCHSVSVWARAGAHLTEPLAHAVAEEGGGDGGGDHRQDDHHRGDERDVLPVDG